LIPINTPILQPLIGTAGALVVTPVGKTPFEGWRFLPESTANPPYYQSQTFEGLYEWQAHTLAYAQNEWKAVTPWNAATSFVLPAGSTRTAAARPVAVGIPGYILAQDQVGKLFLKYSSPIYRFFNWFLRA